MWVIFEGLDKAGKTTLEWEFLKATNFKHVIVDRGPMGYKTFDKIFRRNTNSGDCEFIHQARKIMKSNDFMVVYCFCRAHKAYERLVQHNEACPYDYVEAQAVYNSNVRRFYDKKKVLWLDTTDRSIEECVNLIVKKLKEVQQGEL